MAKHIWGAAIFVVVVLAAVILFATKQEVPEGPTEAERDIRQYLREQDAIENVKLDAIGRRKQE